MFKKLPNWVSKWQCHLTFLPGIYISSGFSTFLPTLATAGPFKL